MTHTTSSRDGTRIAYTVVGDGPPLILVDGALCHRAFGPNGKLAARLARRFTVYTYDRRGRGESGDAAAYAVEREVEDLDAVIRVAGGSAYVCGSSSGGVLALEGARQGLPIRALALYEPPFIVDGSRAPLPADYAERQRAHIAAGRRGAAVKLFMREVEVPAAVIALMRLTPVWSKLEAVAHTLPYDAAVMGDTQAGEALPLERWRATRVPTLVAFGGKSPAWLRNGAHALADVLPYAGCECLPGQTHVVKADALAPVLTGFLTSDTLALAA